MGKRDSTNGQKQVLKQTVVFDSVLGESTVTPDMQVRPLCQNYARRVIGAAWVDYTDESGASVRVNVFRASFQNRLLAIALVADYKALCKAQDLDDSVSWDTVTEKFKHVFDSFKQSLKLNGCCDFSKSQALWDRYVNEVRKLIPDMAKDILTHMQDTDAYLSGDMIPKQQDLASPEGASPLWVGKPTLATGKIMATIKFTKVTGSLRTGCKVNTTGAIYGAITKVKA